MMLPTLLLVGAGSRRRIWLPLPVVLLWPFWVLGWVVWAPGRLLGLERAHALRAALILMTRMSGTRVDVDTARGARIHLRLV